MYHIKIWKANRIEGVLGNGLSAVFFKMPGSVTDDQWRERQEATEERFQRRIGQSQVHRIGGQWVPA